MFWERTTLFGAALLGLFGAAHAQLPVQLAASGEVIIKFKDMRPTSLSRTVHAASKMGLKYRSWVQGTASHVFSIPKGAGLESTLNYLNRQPEVEYAEPNYRLQIFERATDELADQQWSLGALRAPEAWDLSRGDSRIIIAIIDTGVDLNHPDLKAQLVPGFDLVANDNTPQDENGHGTHCAGIVGAVRNNGIGVSGVAGDCRVMPVRVLDENGAGYTDTVARGIVWAADHGAKILSLSLGGPSPSQTLNDAISYASQKGCIVVCAAGNSNTTQRAYPAAYSKVISVGALDESGNRASYSNFGDWVTVAAPGSNVLSTWPDGRYAFSSGTSMATPQVAGVLGLVWARMGVETSPDRVRNRLEFTAEDTGRWVVRGRVNALKAMNDPESADPLRLALTESSIVGSAVARLRVTAAENPGTAWTYFTSSDPAVVRVPTRLRFGAGKNDLFASLTSNPVRERKTVTVTARLGSVTRTVELMVVPHEVIGVSLGRATVSAGSSTQLRFLLNGPAPRTGMVLNLESSNPDVLKLPATFKVRGGAKAGTLTISTKSGSAPTGVRIRATLNGKATEVTLNVR